MNRIAKKNLKLKTKEKKIKLMPTVKPFKTEREKEKYLEEKEYNDHKNSYSCNKNEPNY